MEADRCQFTAVCLLSWPLTFEALATLADETVELVDACSSVLARTWQTVIPVQVTVFPYPSRFTVTAVTVNTDIESMIGK